MTDTRPPVTHPSSPPAVVLVPCGITQPTSGRKGFCWRCDGKLPKYKRQWCGEYCRDLYWNNHTWGKGRNAALKRDGWRCGNCGSGENLEVNHIVARQGGGYGNGCHNHLANLETLCRRCHVVVTRRQNAMRRAGSEAQPPLLLP